MSESDTAFKAELEAMRADMEAQTTVANSMKVAFDGLTGQLAAAIANSKAAGATSEELAAVQQLHDQMKANTQTMIDATKAGTVAQDEPPAPVVPTGDDAAATVTGGTGTDDSGNAPAVA